MTPPRATMPTVHLFGGECGECGSVKERTAEESDYEDALNALILAAKALGRPAKEVRWDLDDWYGRVAVDPAAGLDKETVRRWWVREREATG